MAGGTPSSLAAPWVGIVVIQAKHTNGYNRHFGEADFFDPDSVNAVVSKEVPRIKRLREAGEVDHYMMFANRRLAGNADAAITAHLVKVCGLPAGSIYLCGIEQLELWLKQFQEVAKLADLDPVDSPLIVSSDELALVVEAFARNAVELGTAIDTPPGDRTPYEQKNLLNNMTPEYAKALRKRYLKETAQIANFLAAPENMDIQQSYEAVVEEFQLKIIAKRKEYQNFDAVMEYLLDMLFVRDPILRQKKHKRLTRAMLSYMYWNCDIGEATDTSAE
jgi:hypothetical protein